MYWSVIENGHFQIIENVILIWCFYSFRLQICTIFISGHAISHFAQLQIHHRLDNVTALIEIGSDSQIAQWAYG